MDPITVIVAALAAGAASGATGVAKEGVLDAYAGLKRLVARCLRSSPGPLPPDALIAAHEARPDTYQAPLAEALRDVEAERDGALVEAAQRLLALADPAGAAGGKYQLDLRGATGVQVGDGGTMTVNVASPRPVHLPND